MADSRCCQGCDPSCDGPATCAHRAWAEIERLRAESTVVERLVAGQLSARMTELEADLAAERAASRLIISDLTAEVERLRAERTSLLSAGLAFQAEVERLRAENAEWKRRVMGNTPINVTITQNTEIELLRAEIKRLRAALQLVVDQLEEGFPKSAQQFAMDSLGEHLKEARRD